MKKAIVFFIFAFSMACGRSSGDQHTDRSNLSGPGDSREIGKVLYLKHCEQCHATTKSDHMLADRVRSSQNGFSELQKFVRNQDSLLQAGDPYTLDLNKKWGAQIYRHNFTLTDAELKALFYYLETTF